jgi:hypothetical protein
MNRSEFEADRKREGCRVFHGEPRANGADTQHG